MTRSLVTLTLVLVGGVVLVLGAVVVAWITAEDREVARIDAQEQQDAAEAELRALAEELVALSQDIATGLSEGHSRRLRAWLEEEPFSLYRDPEDPERVDVDAIMRRLVPEARQRGREETERIDILTDRMAEHTEARVEAVMRALREAAERRAEAATDERGDSLIQRFGLLLVGMAILLAVTLVVLVVGPLRRLRGSVKQIAAGDLASPVPQPRHGAEEIVALSRDVERMRDQIRAATEGLEAEVARKTETLAQTLEERTQALSELKAAQDRLVQAAKMAGLGTLAGGVAHEFNNLLGGILGCLESAREASDDPSVLEDLAVARRTAERAAVLVEALLEVSRPGQRDLRPVALADVVDDVLRAAGPTSAQRRITIGREQEGAPVVSGDAGQLHQVVLNLLTNALQAVDDGEAIVVATRVADGHGVVEVRDAGPGIPAEDRDRIFEPFFTGREDGTGLGLFVSYGIVERHGGRIEVGEAEEGGARMRVWIPLANEGVPGPS